MANEMLQREDLAVYIVGGLPKSFIRKLKQFVDQESKDGEVMQLDPELSEWVVARVRGEKRRPHEQSPASAALWRAYRALSAARYHLQGREEEEQVRELRARVDELWREVSPEFPAEPPPDSDLEGEDED